jgi:hypothetical protein
MTVIKDNEEIYKLYQSFKKNPKARGSEIRQ